jgi:hypothetical protein
MEKFGISRKELQMVFEKLSATGRLSQNEVDARRGSDRLEGEPAHVLPKSEEISERATVGAPRETADRTLLDAALRKAWKTYVGTALGFPLAALIFWVRSDGGEPASLNESVRSMEALYFVVVISAVIVIHFARKRKLAAPSTEDFIAPVSYRPAFEQWYCQVTIGSVSMLGGLGLGGFFLLLFHMVCIPVFFGYLAVVIAGIAAFHPKRWELEELALTMAQKSIRVDRPTAAGTSFDI